MLTFRISSVLDFILSDDRGGISVGSLDVNGLCSSTYTLWRSSWACVLFIWDVSLVTWRSDVSVGSAWGMWEQVAESWETLWIESIEVKCSIQMVLKSLKPELPV